MPGNTFGTLFKVTSFGESHGPAMGCVIDGCPPGLSIDSKSIEQELQRRRPGASAYVTQRNETDNVEILSGVFEGKSTGTPIALLIRNQDQRSQDYHALADVFRPGHADYTYWHKYGIYDYRGGGRASARETAVRVAAGAIAKQWLKQHHSVVIRGHLTQLGQKHIPFESWQDLAHNPFFIANHSMVEELISYLGQIRAQQDSVGAKLRIIAEGVPVGWGEPVFDRLDADIAYAMMSINAVKAVEIGAGVQAAAQYGSEHNDNLSPTGFTSNHAGGIVGGISTGQTIEVSITFKPTSSIAQPRSMLNKKGEQQQITIQGRHDPCVGLRATPIAEAMLALVLINHALLHRAQNADVALHETFVNATPPPPISEKSI